MIDEPLARAILQAAIDEGRAAELLVCLFDGGSCTIDPDTKKLVLFPSSLIGAETMEDESQLEDLGLQ